MISYQLSNPADTISCLVLESDIDIYHYASESAADPIADSGIVITVNEVLVDGKPIAYNGPSDGAYRLGDSGTSLCMNILNTWTPTNKVSDIALKVNADSSVAVKFTITGLLESDIVTSTSDVKQTTENTTTTTVTETTSAGEAKMTTNVVSVDVLYGDIDLDGKTELTDAILLNKAIAGQVKPDDQANKNADLLETVRLTPTVLLHCFDF